MVCQSATQPPPSEGPLEPPSHAESGRSCRRPFRRCRRGGKARCCRPSLHLDPRSLRRPPPVIGPSPAHTSPATSFCPHLGTSHAGEQSTPALHPSSPTPAGDRTVDTPSQEANLTGQDTLTSQVSTLTSQVAKLSSVLYPAQHPGPVAPSRAIKGRTAAKKMLQQQCKTIGCKHCSWTGRSGLGYEKHRHHSDIPGILWLAPRGIFPPTRLQGATSTFTSDSSSSPES